MGVFDSVMAPCPECGARHEFQSKSGDCSLAVFELEDAPEEVLAGAIRHAPIACARCGTPYWVTLAHSTVRERPAEVGG